jgi:cyanophycin synthetase
VKHLPIKFLRVNCLQGPNIWTYRTVIEAVIDIGELEDYPSNKIPGFADRLSHWLPGLIEHHCSPGHRGGFLERLQEGTWPGHILEHIALELQTMAGMSLGFGRARSTDQRGVYKVVIRTRQEEVGRQALREAADLLIAAINDEPFAVDEAVKRLMALIDQYALGPSTACIVEAAAERKIPAIRLTSGNLVQLGYGARQKRIWTAETDLTSAIGEGISRDKDLTKKLLASCGVPVPHGEIASTPEQAWELAQELGLPVVIKPTDANHGRGVVLDLRTEQAVRAAFEVAQAEGSEVLVERYIPGQEHRLLIVQGKLIAAARGEQAHILGDGQQTVMQLIESQINADPRRGEEEGFPLDTIRLPENTTVMLELARQGFTPASVPGQGERILVQRTGVMTQDITDEVHPSVAKTAALAARIIGLDIAGIDLVACDISQPLHVQGGAIVEVNAGPGLLMHLKPATGKPRPVGQAILNHLFGPDDDSRIPLIGVTGDQSASQAAIFIAQILSCAGYHCGLSCNERVEFEVDQIKTVLEPSADSAQHVLMNRMLTAAVIECTARQILDRGLAYDRCHVGVVTAMPALAGLQDHYISTTEQMRTVIRTQVDVVLPNGGAVLNADDEVCASLAELCDGEVIFFTTQDNHPLLQPHTEKGGRFLRIKNSEIILCERDGESVLAQCPQANGSGTNGDLTMLRALLATVGASLAMRISPVLIRAGIDGLNLELVMGQPH